MRTTKKRKLSLGEIEQIKVGLIEINSYGIKPNIRLKTAEDMIPRLNLAIEEVGNWRRWYAENKQRTAPDSNAQRTALAAHTNELLAAANQPDGHLAICDLIADVMAAWLSKLHTEALKNGFVPETLDNLDTASQMLKQILKG